MTRWCRSGSGRSQTSFGSAPEMPASLQAHVRYPESFLLAQGLVYAKYHMSDPAVFYNQEDLWVRATEKYYDAVRPVEPYYVMWQLPGSDRPEFVSVLPFTPKRRQVLIGWIAGLCDGENYGRLLAYKFPKERRVLGPQQVETKIDQDPVLSSQLTLWDQRGSSVIRGNVLAIPIEDTLLYVEPIYLQADTAAYPELRLVVVMHGDAISYADTFKGALQGLFDGQPRDQRPLDLLTPDVAAAKGLAQQANESFERYLELQAAQRFEEAGRELRSLRDLLQQLAGAEDRGVARRASRTCGELRGGVLHCAEDRAALEQLQDQSFEHEHPVAAPDHEGMARVGEHAPVRDARHVDEVVEPVLEHAARVPEPLASHELEVRIVVQGPADRHLDQRGVRPEHHRLVELHQIAATRSVGQVVMAHHAALVDEAVREQQLDRVRAQVPGRGAIPSRPLPAELLDGVVRTNETRLLLFSRELCRRNVEPAVMRDLVAALDNPVAGVRVGLDRDARNEPRRPDLVLLEQGQNPRGADHPELASRDRRRTRLPAGDQARDGVEVKAQADDVFGHCLGSGRPDLCHSGYAPRRPRSGIEAVGSGRRA